MPTIGSIAFALLAVGLAAVTCAGQNSGMTCYSKATGEKVPCSRPAPPPYRPPVTTTSPSNTTDNDAARREAERRAAEEKRKRDEALRAEAERQRLERERIERERQEQFERDKKETLDSLKGKNGGDLQLKGGSGTDLQLKNGSPDNLKLKDSGPDYNRVRKPTAVTAVRGGGSGGELYLAYDREGIGRIAEKNGWSDAEVTRFVEASKQLGDFESKDYSPVRREETWEDIKARDVRVLQRIAAATAGFGIPSSGFQTSKYGDCVIFALANAAKLPYGVVAARATGLINSEEWRDTFERNDPQGEVLKVERHKPAGLTGNEMLFLTEAFGQAEVVKPGDFAKVLKAGRPVLVNVSPGHQVVLSKTFHYRGEAWYEMVDSQSKGPWQKRYVKPSELDVLLLENGVSYKPEPGTVVKSLK